ncbi:MAG: hypothetical protein BWK80_61795 [Desulfobacteraceae bacterium IS3]|nr:MAG: hypothetical protein BWK80_61795 [Desulfobacteraceae bacterium IS3]
MQIVKAWYDCYHIRLVEPAEIKKDMKVFVFIPDDREKISCDTARKRLRGSGKGERLTERLLKSRKETQPKLRTESV